MNCLPHLAETFSRLLVSLALLAVCHAANAASPAPESAPQFRKQLFDTCMNSPVTAGVLGEGWRPGFCACAADKSAAVLTGANLQDTNLSSEVNRVLVAETTDHALLVCAQPLRLDFATKHAGFTCMSKPEPNSAIWSLPSDKRALPCQCLERYIAAHADTALFLDHVLAGKLDQHIKVLTEQAYASCTSATTPIPSVPEEAAESPDSDYRAPSIVDINSCRPPYPRASVLAEEEGSVRLKIDIDEYGNYLRSTMLESSKYINLDRSTENYFRACNYRPATRRGMPVAGSLRVTYVWRLNQE